MSYPVGMSAPPFDPTRAAALYRLFAKPVFRRLQSRYSWADPEWVADAVVDAILTLAAHPGDVSEGMVFNSAHGKFGTHVRSERRRKNREKNVGKSVTKSAPAATTVLDALADRELLREREDRVAHTPIARTPVEHQLLELMLAGRTDPAEMAAATGLSENEARKTYNRLRQRMSRERKLAATEAS
jgi:DNA-directed RNA polymerase specialized sigma24 family protein